MVDTDQVFAGLAQRTALANPAVPEDYMQDGVLYCGKCHTPKQTVISLAGKAMTVACLCKCAAETYQRQEEGRKAREFRGMVNRNRQEGFTGTDLAKWRFDRDDGKDQRTMDIMRRYVDHFPEFLPQGRGLILYGRCGSGKTFAAACVANALIDLGYRCHMTNFSRIATTVMGMRDGKQAYLDSLNRFALLAVDDLGAERETEYMAEMVYNIIDSRYRAGLPMIITTNLPIDALKHPRTIAEQRVYNRILERCAPVAVNAMDRRRNNIIQEFDGVKAVLGL